MDKQLVNAMEDLNGMVSTWLFNLKCGTPPDKMGDCTQSIFDTLNAIGQMTNS